MVKLAMNLWTLAKSSSQCDRALMVSDLWWATWTTPHLLKNWFLFLMSYQALLKKPCIVDVSVFLFFFSKFLVGKKYISSLDLLEKILRLLKLFSTKKLGRTLSKNAEDLWFIYHKMQFDFLHRNVQNNGWSPKHGLPQRTVKRGKNSLNTNHSRYDQSIGGSWKGFLYSFRYFITFFTRIFR